MSTSGSNTDESLPRVTSPAYAEVDEEKNLDTPTPTDSDDLSKTQSIAEQLPLLQEVIFVAVVVLAQFTAQCGLAQVLSILYIIGDDFGITSQSELSWLVAGYSLTVGTFILISGRLGDMYGYKRLFIIGFAWYAVWSMVAGLAVYSNKVLFIFSRVLQGIGPAITLPNGLALLGATYAPGKRKDMVFAIFGATAPGGAIVGGVFAALFALAWWPWAFWSFAIALASIAVVAIYVIPDPPKKIEVSRMSLRQKLIALDIGGATIGIAALVLFNFAWNQAPIVGWKQPYVYICLILGILFFAAFFYIEMRLAPEPLIPFEALSSEVGYVLACVAFGWSSFGVWIWYLYQFLLQVRHLPPLLVMAQLSPLAISGACAAVITGYALSRLRPAVIMTISLCFFLTGNLLMGTAPVGQTYWAQTFVCTLIIPFGMDMSFPAATVVLSNSVEKKHQGIAASLVSTVVNYSISLGLGFAGTVEAYTKEGDTAGQEALYGIRHSYYVAFGLAGAGLVLSLIFVAMDYFKRRKGTAEK